MLRSADRRSMSWVLRAFAATSALALVGGCQLITSVDENRITSGSGGDAPTTASSSSTGGATCDGGITACTTPADCEAPANACIAATCEMGCCGTANVPDLTPKPTGQTSGNCQAIVCDGNGGEKIVDDAGDPPAPTDACHVGACDAGAPKQDFAAEGATCAFDGGKVCDAAGACVECNTSADCANEPTDTICDEAQNICIPPTCVDHAQNGEESDIDCGGSACPKCADNLKCAGNADCESGVCTGGLCAVPSCTDSTENGTETDVDCGGSCALAPTNKLCAFGQKCAQPEDCATGACDGVQCVYKPQSAPCATDDECGPSGSDLCVDGVCCNNSCAANGCFACTAALKGAGGDGLCGPVTTGNDPKNACADQGAASCGGTGACDGAGACQLYAAGTVCRATAGICDAVETCPGAGAACPADGFSPNTTVCRPAVPGGCDVAENCPGTGVACPTDVVLPNTTVCRPVNGICDVAENCTGSANACPTDSFVPFGTTTPSGQTAADCQKIVCTGTGASSTTSVDDVTDPPTTTPTLCLRSPACAGTPLAPSFSTESPGFDCTGDNQPPAVLCGDGAFVGVCVQCNSNANCSAPTPTCNTSNHTCF